MANEHLINQKIKEKDDYTLSTLFKPNFLIQKINHSTILPPFDKLIFLQKEGLNTLSHHKKLIEGAISLGSSYAFVKRRVISNIRFCNENTECAKYLLILFNRSICRPVVGNLILLFYMRMRSYKLMNNLVAVIDEQGILRDEVFEPGNDNDRKKNREDSTDTKLKQRNEEDKIFRKDKMIFYVFKAIVAFKNEKFTEAESLFRVLVQHKSLQKRKNVIKELKDLFGVTLFMNDKNGVCVNQEINSLMSLVKKCKLKEISESNDRIVGVNFFLLTVRNLILFCYEQFSKDHKLELKWLKSAFVLNGVDEDEWIFFVLKAVSNGRIKGNISVNRELMIFSKTDPFPGVKTVNIP